ncbi:peptidase M48 Ste24p [Methanocaldococcus vulcanius M7]|uniref:Peptidase M48 Ste24p n=1 Tax=Methanocaldococcus vulcanius (strain ATCC 700851 / DSM 12094 / M7) TaxID=579137 RepID=C9REB2_METVM|nr:M56 family metallopeptidase [Methanocaldococcus vulcanius]ACX71914.1 peptidase M48 Ste24p [Methanocaldococcus vulcanius M7]
MKKFVIILILLTLFQLSFGVNVSVDIDSYGWITITSEKNISKNLENLKYLQLWSSKNGNIYIFQLKVPLNKNKSQLIYNLSPIGKFHINKVSTEKFFKINDYKVENGEIIVNYSYNFTTIAILLLEYLFIFILTLYFTHHLKKLFRKKSATIREKSEVLKKYTIHFTLYAISITVILITQLLIFDLPDLISYTFNVGLDTAIIIWMLMLFVFMLLPPVLAAKDMVRCFSSQKSKDRNENEIKKSPLMVALSFILLFAPLGIMFLIIIYGIPNMLISPIKTQFYDLPLPLRTAFWITFYYSIAVLFSKTSTQLLKYTKIMKRINDEETINKIKNIVNDISKKLNVKPFKKIEIIKSDVANAMVEGLFKEKLVITSKLLDILSEEELKAIIAHELAHRKKLHIKLGFISFIIIGAIIYSIAIYILKYINIEGEWVFTAVFFTAYIIDYLLCRYISRKIEKDADLLATKIIDPKTYIKALAKIHFSSYMPKEGILNVLMTHPSLKERARYIQETYGLSKDDVDKIIEEAYQYVEKVVNK